MIKRKSRRVIRRVDVAIDKIAGSYGKNRRVINLRTTLRRGRRGRRGGEREFRLETQTGNTSWRFAATRG